MDPFISVSRCFHRSSFRLHPWFLMTPERWQQVEYVLQAALDLPPHERSSFLDETCAGDKQMKAEAASLIDAYNQAGDFIEEPAIAQDASIFVGNDIDCKLGCELGPYKIVER